MKIQDLQQPYKALAEMRREQQINSEWVKKWDNDFKETKDLNYAFDFRNTPEGNDWWFKVLLYDITPKIPAASLEELKEWQNPEYEATVIAEQPKEETFRVKITKATKLKYWYSNKIGEEFEVTQSELYSESYQFKIYGMLYFIDKVDCEILQPTGKNEFDTPFNTKALSSQEPDQRLFQAALAAMQGMLADPSNNEIGAAFILENLELPKGTAYNFLEHYPKYISLVSWNYAEALINEGKKRGKLD